MEILLPGNDVLPVLTISDFVPFPEMKILFDVKSKTISAPIDYALHADKKIVIVLSDKREFKDTSFSDLREVGVIAKITQYSKGETHRGIAQVSITCLKRVRLLNIAKSEKCFTAEVEEESFIELDDKQKDYSLALMNLVKDKIAGVSMSPSSIKRIPLFFKIMNLNDPGKLADYIAGNFINEIDEKQKILEIFDPIARLMYVSEKFEKESYIMEIEDEISNRIQEKIDKEQRNYYLREQLSVISEELNGYDNISEVDEIREKIDNLRANDEVKGALLKECNKLSKYSTASPESGVVRDYLDICLDLPWGIYSKENKSIAKSEKILNADHYGLQKVKERIIEYLAVSSIAQGVKGQILCLVGPPGIGKTSIAKSIAKATGRNFQRISLGGVRDEAEIRGHRRTYIGSMPGRIINTVKKSGTSNPLILLDEIDKMSSDYKGDPSSALLEVLDPEQNNSFVDHYIDLPFDLSQVLFITTANDKSNIPAPLADRMEIIELSSYTIEEKLNIAVKHLIKKQLSANGLSGNQIKFSNAAIYLIIEGYTKEAGVRNLEQKIASICRKAAIKIAKGEIDKITIKPNDISEYLGTIKFKKDNTIKESEIGVANGLAWTAVGGEMLEAEAAVLDGNGKIELTGSLGDVMQESAKAAISFIRSQAKLLDIDSEFYKTKDIHIHFPEGAVPKDGPSAGVTVSTAVVSALTGKKIRKDVAMTGEITLRGRILPIGGLKEKSMAAFKNGIKTVIIPNDNISDLDEIETVVKNGVNFIPVKFANEAWNIAIEDFGGK